MPVQIHCILANSIVQKFLLCLVMRKRCYLCSISSSICVWQEMDQVVLLKLCNDLSGDRNHFYTGPASNVQPLPSTIWGYNDNHIWNYIISVRYLLFLDASSHLIKRLCPSVGRSVGRSVRRWRFRQKRENRWFWPKIMRSHIISSSYNHFIIMRTHRWPYGPCYMKLRIWNEYF